MTGFTISAAGHKTIRFTFYREAAPATCQSFSALLPFSRVFSHARISGQEIWIDDTPRLNIPQENASVFTEPGEVVFGPSKPERNKTANCMGIYYGDGKGLDACNIFARVFDQDLPLLAALGESIWKNGTKEILFEALD